MSYLAKTLITPILGQYTFTFPGATATATDIFTPVFLNGTNTFLDYCNISGQYIILQPGNYLIECYISATKSLSSTVMYYNLEIDGINAVAPKGNGNIGGSPRLVRPDGFQYDLTVPENTTSSIRVKANTATSTVTYIPQASTMLIWRI